MPGLLRGLGVTIMLGVVSFVLGFVLGGLITLARISRSPVLKATAIAYVSLLRGTPLLIQIMLVYFGLPQLGVRIAPIPSAILAFTLYSAAYLSENLRGGVLAIDQGQWEAADSMGMSHGRSLRRIIYPQALRVATPAIGGRFIALMKDTSLASVITVVELTRVAESTGSSSFRYVEAFVLAGAVYWLINAVLSIGQAILERRMGRAYT
ncbi:amino acid ABC transporter permease [Actinomadura alba]|uniref:Amino acid ABC transporter permease n=2 Tax=Actinomadura alba TaxID=406431 RepID=A0ABR7M1B1_9ACTN|nr:amino acid ABC transporter permease [Actinomadura alba]